MLDYDGNYQTHFSTGVQPDMVCFTPDGNAVLTADEGEPRNGYEAGEDPGGSITMVDLSQGIDNATAQTVGFEKFDAQRDNLVNEGVLLKTGLMPSQDFEPEYIAGQRRQQDRLRLAAGGKLYCGVRPDGAGVYLCQKLGP